jgi:hypothetical protein
MVFTCFASQLSPTFIEHPRQNDVTTQLHAGAPRRTLSEISDVHADKSEDGTRDVNSAKRDGFACL